MKIVQINSVCGSGSTGKICVDISTELNNRGIENYILYTCGDCDYEQSIKCAARFQRFESLKSRVFGNYGFNSSKTTKLIIEQLKNIKPDLVLLHNLHAHNCNLQELFEYFRANRTKLIWTFHDCWAFTAYCPHYAMIKCDNWQKKCINCPQIRTFSWFRDDSERMFERKKSTLLGQNLIIVTPSIWLANQVKRSFLRKYPIRVINNGIRMDLFKPIVSDFRKKHNVSNDKFIVLGVAIKWVPRKGVDVFIRLAKRLNPDKFQIVLVGTDKKIDKQLPNNIISIHRTANQKELAEIYTAADLFVNPTREENFPTVNLESMACGTPVLTYRTGGSPESIDENSGLVVDCDDEQALYDAILKIEAERPFSSEDCRNRALQFSAETKYSEYTELLLEIASKN